MKKKKFKISFFILFVIFVLVCFLTMITYRNTLGENNILTFIGEFIFFSLLIFIPTFFVLDYYCFEEYRWRLIKITFDLGSKYSSEKKYNLALKYYKRCKMLKFNSMLINLAIIYNLYLNQQYRKGIKLHNRISGNMFKRYQKSHDKVLCRVFAINIAKMYLSNFNFKIYSYDYTMFLANDILKIIFDYRDITIKISDAWYNIGMSLKNFDFDTVYKRYLYIADKMKTDKSSAYIYADDLLKDLLNRATPQYNFSGIVSIYA